MTNKYVGAAQFVKNLITGGKKSITPGGAINKVPTNIPKTEIQKKIRDLKIETQKLKGSGAKLDQTVFEIQNKKPITFKKSNKKSESKKEAYKRIQGENTKVFKSMIDDAFNEKKAKGGRVGLKGGSFPDLNKDGKTTFADVLIGRGVLPKNKKKMVAKKTKTPMQKAIKKDKKRII